MKKKTATVLAFPFEDRQFRIAYDHFADCGFSAEASAVGAAFSLEIDELRDELADAHDLIKRLARRIARLEKQSKGAA